MRVGPMTPTVPMPDAVVVGRSDQAERPQVRVEMLGADDDRQPGTVDVFVQQPHQPLLLFDHLQQRLQRLSVSAAGLRRAATTAPSTYIARSSGRSEKVEVASRIARASSAS